MPIESYNGQRNLDAFKRFDGREQVKVSWCTSNINEGYDLRGKCVINGNWLEIHGPTGNILARFQPNAFLADAVDVGNVIRVDWYPDGDENDKVFLEVEALT